MLEWMEANQPRLLQRMMEESPDPDASLEELFDGAMRAHLVMVAEALAERLGGEAGDHLLASLDEVEDGLHDEAAFNEERAAVLSASLHEAQQQFGPDAPNDPKTREWSERRATMMAWPRLLVRAVDEQLAVFDIALAPAAFAWISANTRRLGRLGIRTLEAHMERDTGGREAVGEAASLQTHVRFLVEALGAALGDDVDEPPGGPLTAH
jgi:hypothetical protein